MKRMPWTAFFSVTMPETGERKVSVRRASPDLRQGLDLLFGNVPVLQAQQAGVGQLLHAVLRLAAGVLQRFDALRGDRVFALRRNQFRAVHLEQRLALADRLAGGIDVQALDLALELRRDGVQAALVGLDPAGGADHLVERRAVPRLRSARRASASSRC